MTLPETVDVMPAGRLPTVSASPTCAFVNVMVAPVIEVESASVIEMSLSAIETPVPFSVKVAV